MIKATAFLGKSLAHKIQKVFSHNFLSGSTAVYAEQMYAQWLQDNKSVHSSWDAYFLNISANLSHGHAFITPEQLLQKGLPLQFGNNQQDNKNNKLVNKISKMINSIRTKGHYISQLDPLGLTQGMKTSKINDEFFSASENGISIEEDDIPVDLSALGKSGFHTSKLKWTAKEVRNHFLSMYSGKIAFQYMHITEPDIVKWIQDKIEHYPIFRYSNREKLALLDRVLESQSFNAFCERKYSTYKRFGCEGLDSGISGMGKLSETAAQHQVNEVVIGMAHRGRLNVLCCVLGKPYNQIFAEFEDIKYTPAHKEIYKFSGDVKYHLGCSSKRKFSNGNEVIFNLLPNPSHLEAVYPVALGTARARQSKLDQKQKAKVLPVVIHGDAALAGQGIIYETQQMEKIDGFNVAGCIHIVFNNQIGFTTDSVNARSGHYPTGIAKINNNFVIHVNADEPEEVDFAMQLAVDYRMEFESDVYINLVGYRRFGHNEQDNAQFTQPEMFAKIQQHPHMYLLYGKQLEKEGVITKEYFDKRLEHFMDKIDKEHRRTMSGDIQLDEWDPYGWNEVTQTNKTETGIPKDKFFELGKAINVLPEKMNVHKTLKKTYAERLNTIVNGKDIDWATGEALAYASLLDENRSLRLCGEDCERGTFSHRHSVVHDQVNFDKYTPLRSVIKNESKVKLEIVNSLLSEYAVLGFEYGHSITQPNDLTIWEAQFGDFMNGAQIIIDQFLMTGEKKWLKKTNLTLLLPHGYDGQGPEHSNARLERFLANVLDDYVELSDNKELRAKNSEKVNAIILNITNPANFFHAIRRQVNSHLRKPLVIFTPKRLLKHKLVRSETSEFVAGSEFQRIYDETEISHEKVKRVLLCSGQIYFDLLEYRQEHKIDNVALIRMEQLAPFAYNTFEKVISKYDKSCQVKWVSEEHLNFGAFSFMEPRMNIILKENGFSPLGYVGRAISATAATGSGKQHKLEIAKLLKDAFN